MSVYVYYSPGPATPVNDRRAGTIRLASDSQTPIRLNRGWDNTLYFVFKSSNQRSYSIHGSTVTARLFNSEKVQVLSKTLKADNLMTPGLGILNLSNVETGMLTPGFYSLVIEIDDNKQKFLCKTPYHSKDRFVVEIIDHDTVSLHI